MKAAVVSCLVAFLCSPFAFAQSGANPAWTASSGCSGPPSPIRGRAPGRTRRERPDVHGDDVLQSGHGEPPVAPGRATCPIPSSASWSPAWTGGGRIVQISDRSYIKHGFFALSNNQCTHVPVRERRQRLLARHQLLRHLLDRQQREQPRSRRRHQSLDRSLDSGRSAGRRPFQRREDRSTPTLIVGGRDATTTAPTTCSRAGPRSRVGATCAAPPAGSPIPQPAGLSARPCLCEPDANRGQQLGLAPDDGHGTTPATGVRRSPRPGRSSTARCCSAGRARTITSNTNGNPDAGPSDGRVYVAVKVTGPTNGKYHYEYAVHNRDNKGGVGVFRVPSCPSAIVSGVGFHDVDVPASAANDWTFANNGSELTWTAPAGNSLRWNMLFNFWFDSDAAPGRGQHHARPGGDRRRGRAVVHGCDHRAERPLQREPRPGLLAPTRRPRCTRSALRPAQRSATRRSASRAPASAPATPCTCTSASSDGTDSRVRALQPLPRSGHLRRRLVHDGGRERFGRRDVPDPGSERPRARGRTATCRRSRSPPADRCSAS